MQLHRGSTRDLNLRGLLPGYRLAEWCSAECKQLSRYYATTCAHSTSVRAGPTCKRELQLDWTSRTCGTCCGWRERCCGTALVGTWCRDPRATSGTTRVDSVCLVKPSWSCCLNLLPTLTELSSVTEGVEELPKTVEEGSDCALQGVTTRVPLTSRVK